MQLIFEKSVKGRMCCGVPKSDVPQKNLPESFKRTQNLPLPEVAEITLARHYTELAQHVHGVNNGFYPLGSCTMKYNPAVNEELSALSGFANVHPLQPAHTVQGCLEVMVQAEQCICEVTGMDAVTFQPAAGAHGEFCGLLMIKAYHEDKGDFKRNKVIIPDSAHGTNPATATMNGFEVINVPSLENGCVDVEKLREVVGDDTAALMLTNPNTLGIFDKNIIEITDIIHKAGGLNYYDGANLNAIMGIVRPGDMGFDVIHLNLHKTMSTPHGGGGPGSGAVGAKNILKPFLPAEHAAFVATNGENSFADGKSTSFGAENSHNSNNLAASINGEFTFEISDKTIGRVLGFYGNFAVTLRALCYMLALGGGGLRQASITAVLNANYMKSKIEKHCKVVPGGICMHEFVMSLEDIKKETGVRAMDIAKAMLDYKMHPPTMYFPLIVPEALMIEPTETEPKETLDFACDTIISLIKKAHTCPEELKNAPLTTPIGRPDEVKAARTPVLRYEFND